MIGGSEKLCLVSAALSGLKFTVMREWSAKAFENPIHVLSVPNWHRCLKNTLEWNLDLTNLYKGSPRCNERYSLP